MTRTIDKGSTPWEANVNAMQQLSNNIDQSSSINPHESIDGHGHHLHNDSRVPGAYECHTFGTVPFQPSQITDHDDLLTEPMAALQLFPLDCYSLPAAEQATTGNESYRWKPDPGPLPRSAADLLPFVQDLFAALLDTSNIDLESRVAKRLLSNEYPPTYVALRAWKLAHCIFVVCKNGCSLSTFADPSFVRGSHGKPGRYHPDDKTGRLLPFKERFEAVKAALMEPAVRLDVLDGRIDLEVAVVAAPKLVAAKKIVYKRNNDIRAAKNKVLRSQATTKNRIKEEADQDVQNKNHGQEQMNEYMPTLTVHMHNADAALPTIKDIGVVNNLNPPPEFTLPRDDQWPNGLHFDPTVPILMEDFQANFGVEDAKYTYNMYDHAQIMDWVNRLP